jgi:hypothetical protein
MLDDWGPHHRIVDHEPDLGWEAQKVFEPGKRLSRRARIPDRQAECALGRLLSLFGSHDDGFCNVTEAIWT